MGTTLKREPCPTCKSSDNLVTFLTSSGKETKQCKTPNCKGIGQKDPVYGQKTTVTDKLSTIRGLSPSKLVSFNVHIQDRKWFFKYEKGFKERYIQDGEKKFFWNKDVHQQGELYLLDQCNTSEPLIITEGEFDALSFWEIGHQAVSLNDGAISAKYLLVDKLKAFPQIILAFDNDEAGREATEVAATILKRSQIVTSIVTFGDYKDANEVLQKDPKLLKQILTKHNRPKGIIFGNEINYDDLRTPLPKGADVPFQKIQDMTGGLLPGNLWLFIGGPTTGKSTFFRVMAKSFREQGLKVAHLAVEEDYKKTAQSYIAQEANVPLIKVMKDPSIVDKELWDSLYNEVINTEHMVFIDPVKFKMSLSTILEVCQYLVHVKKYNVIMLDTLTAIIGSINETKKGVVGEIDNFMEQLVQLAGSTGVSFLASAQLKRVEPSNFIRNGIKENHNKDWSEGRIPSMHDIKGSGSLEQKPDVIIAVARNSLDEAEKNIVKLFIRKNRWGQVVGPAGDYDYVPKTGRLVSK